MYDHSGPISMLRYSGVLFQELEVRLTEELSRQILARYGVRDVPVVLQRPELAGAGDWAVPIAFQLARGVQLQPKRIAEDLVRDLDTVEGFSAFSVGGNGYIQATADRYALFT